MKCECCGMYVNEKLDRCINCAFPQKKKEYPTDKYYKILEDERIEAELNCIYGRSETLKRRGVEKGA